MGRETDFVNNSAFYEIVSIIESARTRAYKVVNRELITMYWDIGEYISKKTKESGWGKSVVVDFSNFLKINYAELRGFSPQNIWRMKQFFEMYAESEKLSPLVREISWSNNLLIMSGAKTDEALTEIAGTEDIEE